jgi:hypothetical protein
MSSIINSNYENNSNNRDTNALANSFAASLSIAAAPSSQQPQPKKYLKIKLPDDKKPKPVFAGKRPDIKADVVS